MSRLAKGVIDSSALYAMAFGEPSAEAFRQGFSRCDRLLISAATLAEISLVIDIRKGFEAIALLDALLAAHDVAVVPFAAGSLAEFRHGARHFRSGASPARLNFGDLFSYALAKAENCPLFFQGADFVHADIANAMAELGFAISPDGVPRLD